MALKEGLYNPSFVLPVLFIKVKGAKIMIKMIRGNFGLHSKGGVVVKTPQDEPFSCDKEIEARLVKDEFAIYVDEQETKGTEEVQTPVKQEAGGDNSSTEKGSSSEPIKDEETEFDPVAAKTLGVPVLKTLAESSYGIKAEDLVKADGKDKTKAQIIELIEAVIAKREELAKKAEECTEDCSQCDDTECAKHPDNAEENETGEDEEEEEATDLDLGSGESGVQ